MRPSGKAAPTVLQEILGLYKRSKKTTCGGLLFYTVSAAFRLTLELEKEMEKRRESVRYFAIFLIDSTSFMWQNKLKPN